MLGDGTGDEEGEWVTALGQLLGHTRKVTIRNLDPSDPTRYAAQLTYGLGPSAATIWNGSRKGVGSDYAAKRLDFLVPATPDAVLLSHGRDDTAGNIASRLETTYDALQRKWPDVPVVVMLQAQNLDDRIAPVRQSAARWAGQHKLTTVDVAAAFKAAGNPMTSSP